ncbi:Serine/arginine-rich splicing factor 7 [Tupaia chinensis]|uniref:Serine/arginine-rich splicing factor 7 n=2 Tax=Tupaia chinensis TaxID=246437 RepID=L9KND9_TUPCH|nr:Serine/arginine-rich splicing factor 7 [Tupaia chinensis]
MRKKSPRRIYKRELGLFLVLLPGPLAGEGVWQFSCYVSPGHCELQSGARGPVIMSRYGRYGGETKVYVGNLGTGAGKGELERAFSYYGPLRTVWIARNPPGFAFVEFEDPRDAEDAVRGLDGK